MEDLFYVSLETRTEFDVDEHYELGALKEMIYDPTDKFFYLVTNKHQGKLGFFVLRIERNPAEGKFLIQWKNRLDIGDVNLSILNQNGLKEIIISYKIIYLNTFNVVSIDISGAQELMLFRHESSQLWESKSMGFLLNQTMDYIHISA